MSFPHQKRKVRTNPFPILFPFHLCGKYSKTWLILGFSSTKNHGKVSPAVISNSFVLVFTAFRSPRPNRQSAKERRDGLGDGSDSQGNRRVPKHRRSVRASSHAARDCWR